jgi:hypothetical protein
MKTFDSYDSWYKYQTPKHKRVITRLRNLVSEVRRAIEPVCAGPPACVCGISLYAPKRARHRTNFSLTFSALNSIILVIHTAFRRRLPWTAGLPAEVGAVVKQAIEAAMAQVETGQVDTRQSARPCRARKHFGGPQRGTRCRAAASAGLARRADAVLVGD